MSLLTLLAVAAAAFGAATVAGVSGFGGAVVLLPAYMAAALLVGLLGDALAGAWWLDLVVGFLIAGLAVNEGLEAWRGEGCCVADPLAGAELVDDCVGRVLHARPKLTLALRCLRGGYGRCVSARGV